MDISLKLSRLDWWVYFLVVISLFSIALVLNYLVKKINEARLDERFMTLRSKISNNRSVQVQRRVESRLPPRVPLEIVLEQSNPSTVKGISLVFNKYDNAAEDQRHKDQIDIKNFPDSKWLTTKTDVTDNSTVIGVTSKLSEFPESKVSSPVFLGKIYKDLSIVARSKSLTSADRINEFYEINSKTVSKKVESKSTPSVKKLLDAQTDEDLTNWSTNLAQEELKTTTSTSECNQEIDK